MDKIIANIKKFRELKNLTRDEVAAKLEMSISGYSKLERGDVELTINKLYRISQILEVQVSQILNFDTSQIFNNNDYGISNLDIKYRTNIYPDLYKDKYIKMLEKEVERLKKLEEKK
jgi:transcriptional regulator with XRE-family HTH domain